MRLPFTTLLAAAIGISSCAPDTPSNSGTAMANDAAGSLNAVAETVSTRKVPELGRCHMGECSWSAEENRATIKEDPTGKLVRLTLVGGTSHHKDNKNYPGRYHVGEKIVWEPEGHQVYVFCSPALPAVMMKTGTSWQTDVLDFVNGPPGILEGSVSIYMSVCHKPKEDWAASGFAARYGYRAPSDEQLEVSIHSPNEIFQVARWVSANVKNGEDAPVEEQSSESEAQIPAAFRGEWNKEIADCGTGNNDSLLRVSSDKVMFYESEASVKSVALTSTGAVTVHADYSGEGEKWKGSFTWFINDRGDLVDGDFSRKRCP